MRFVTTICICNCLLQFVLSSFECLAAGVSTTFDDWPDTTTNIGCHAFADWILCTGAVIDASVVTGKAAELSSAINATNYIRSPYVTSGAGRITFSFKSGTNGMRPTNFAVELSGDEDTWLEIGRVSNISHNLSYYELYRYDKSPVFVRLRSFAEPGTNIPIKIIDEGFSGGATAPADWFFSTGIDTYTSDSNSGKDPPALKFDNTNDIVVTPPVSNPSLLMFWLKGNSVSTNSYFLIEGSTITGWVVVTNIFPISNLESNFTINVDTTLTQFRFSYGKDAGNVGLDDVVVRSELNLSPEEPSKSLIIDDIVIDPIDPSIDLRRQDFDAWPTEAIYGDYTFHGWHAARRVVIDTQNAYVGQVARLRNIEDDQPFIESPPYIDGIGVLRFQYRHWNGLTPTVTLLIQTSTNQSDWTTHDAIIVSNAVYHQYSRNMNLTNGTYSVRLYLTNGAERVLLDEIEALKPSFFSLDPPDINNLIVGHPFVYVQSIGNSNSWTILPEYATNLVDTSINWLPLPIVGSDYTSGIDLIWFDTPQNEPHAFIRVRYIQNE